LTYSVRDYKFHEKNCKTAISLLTLLELFLYNFCY